MWAQGNNRFRWSVAFPIIESYDVDGWPLAREIFGSESYRRLYAHSSATLRPLNDNERTALNDLQITQREAFNSWIGIDDEFPFAEQSEIPQRISKLVDHDLGGAALEGETEERKGKLRRRAAWIANLFWQRRFKAGQVLCDNCKFDPACAIDREKYSIRTIMDVHHLNPLEEGKRYTTQDDFALLCPTCHRMEHMMLRKGETLLSAFEQN